MSKEQEPPVEDNVANDKPEKSTTATQPQPARTLVAIKKLPAGAYVKVEQSENRNVKLTVGNNEKQESIVLSPSTAKTVSELLRVATSL